MAGPGNDKGSSSMGCSYDPPPLSITLKKLEDLPKKMKRWSTDHCPVDILLLTVEDCEFLACYYYLRGSFKSYEKSIGFVYFGKMGEDEDEDETLKVALLKCSKESSDPGGSQTAARNAVTLLRPKATFLVGFCYSTSPGKAQLGDVVLSLMLTTGCHKTLVSRDVGNLVRSAAHGWKAPLENPKACKVTVHCDAEILCCSDLNGARQQCQSHPGAIAVEMEGKGLFAAAHDMKMEWLLVKGVCDFLNGSGSTDDSWKTFACAMAASVVSNILSNSFLFGEWPHYGDITAGKESRKSVDPSDNKRRRLAGSVEFIAQLQQMQLDASKVNDKTDLKTEMKKTASDKGFRIVDNEGSGNCMFYALSDQLEIAMRIKIKHDELRQTLVQYLRKNPKLPDETNLSNFVYGHQSWADYLTYMERDGAWGDHVILCAAANCYKTFIRVVSSLYATHDVIVRPQCPVDKSRTLVLGHIHEVHYVSLHSTQDNPVGEESCKSDDSSENKCRKLADISVGEVSCKSGDPSENKRRRPADFNYPSPSISRVEENVRQGTPTNDELEKLGKEIAVKWMQLGRRLGVEDSKLQDIDQRYKQLCEKGYHMLMAWKQEKGSAATYKILNAALQHGLIQRRDLAEQICHNRADISAGEESCKSSDPSENKRRRLADNSVGEESYKSSDPSENKRRELAEPLNVEKCQEQLKSYYRTFSKVKIVPWDDSSSIQIDEIYTPLSWVRDHRKPSGVTQEELEDYTDMLKGKPTRMLVYGRPGIGKSTFCKKAAYEWSKALKEILMNFYILLLIKLRDVCDLKDIRDVLRASKLLAGDGPISVDSLYDYIVNNQDKVLLILDGYDEYSCSKERSPILEIWKGEQLRDCHVIVTTRQSKCDEIRGPSHVQFEISGFKGWRRIQAFARKFLAGEDVQEFMSYLRENDLLDMAEIPLLLLMLCLLWKEKGHEGLPTARADIYTQFIQTMIDHKDESQQPIPFEKVTSTEATKDLSTLGKVAFDALLQDRLYVRCSELPDSISRTFEKLSEVGLFQIVNMTSLNREKGAYFIHKSIQEFLAAWHIKEEVFSIEGVSTLSLSKVDSLEKIVKMNEVLKFACELSTEAACTVFHHLGSVGRKESLSEFEFSEPLQSIEDLPEDLQQYLKFISHSYFCCSAENRRDLLSTLSSLTGGILPLDSNQLNIVANEQLLKCAVIPEFIFFSENEIYSEKSQRDLITVAEHTNAVVVSCSGEKKAADFLMKHSHERLDDFFFKKEGKIVLYVCTIGGDGDCDALLIGMLQEFVSSTAESTQEKRLGGPLNEHDNQTALCSTEKIDSIADRTPHSLSCTRNICIFDIEKQGMETLVNLLPICSSLREIVITGKPFETHDAQLTETLVSGIIFTHRLNRLELCDINLTAKPAAAIARSLHQAPSLCVLALSRNPLGEGLSVLSRHLSYALHLDLLELHDVKMTKEQMNDLSAAVRQSNISSCQTNYHDGKGNVNPEEEWQTDEDWEEELYDLDDEQEAISDFADEQDSGSDSDSDGGQESWSVTDSGDK